MFRFAINDSVWELENK